MRALHYVTVGHLARDIKPDGSHVLGGTVYYSGVQAHRLGARVTVVSSGSDDLDLSTLPDGIRCHVGESAHSTVFENIYHDSGERCQNVRNVAALLHPNNTPALEVAADLVHLAPIIDEVSAEYVSAFPESMLCVTPQGWMRSPGDDGSVMKKKWEDAEVVLGSADACVFSEEDVSHNEDQIAHYAALCPVSVCTRGGSPASLFVEGFRTDISAYRSFGTSPTGAGDIFAAAFFIRFAETRDPHEAVTWAHIAAGKSLEGEGIECVLDRESITKLRKEWKDIDISLGR